MSRIARLADRALVSVTGPEARPFLNRLLTQEVETLPPGGLRSAALLTPQGRLLYDLFLFGEQDGVVIDVAASVRDALVMRLNAYRLRADARVAAVEGAVFALWDAEEAPAGWRGDLRDPAAGFRFAGDEAPVGGGMVEGDYLSHRRALALVEAVADGVSDRAYATEANLDLHAGVDFSKGCFIGQETTSRMKRRGGIRSRVLPLDAPDAAAGAEVSAGGRRAGEVVAAGVGGPALALLRLDRLAGAALSVGSRPAELKLPPNWPEPLPAASVSGPEARTQPEAGDVAELRPFVPLPRADGAA